MKNLILVLSFILLCNLSFAQKKKQGKSNDAINTDTTHYSIKKQADYDNAVGTFMKFYNNNQADSICEMFSDTWGKTKKTIWKAKDITELKEKYGVMKAYSYLAKDPDVMLYKVTFTKSVHVMGLSLDKKNKLLTFRFHTSSDRYDEMLKKAK